MMAEATRKENPMMFRDLILLLALATACFVLYLYAPSEENLTEIWQDGYNTGYKEYLIDRHIPAYGILEQIPDKTRDRDLKKKFKG